MVGSPRPLPLIHAASTCLTLHTYTQHVHAYTHTHTHMCTQTHTRHTHTHCDTHTHLFACGLAWHVLQHIIRNLTAKECCHVMYKRSQEDRVKNRSFSWTYIHCENQIHTFMAPMCMIELLAKPRGMGWWKLHIYQCRYKCS